MIFTFLALHAFVGLVRLLWYSAGGAGLELLRLNGGCSPMADRKKAVDTPPCGLVLGGPAVVPVVACGCDG